MSDEDEWDAEEIQTQNKSKWDEEEESDNELKDEWDAESEEEVEVEVAPPIPIVVPVKKKTNLAQKIAIRKEQEELLKARQFVETEESELDVKQRLQQSVMKSDLDNARELVGSIEISDSKSLDQANPKTRLEFEEYLRTVTTKFATLESEIPYFFFVESLMRNLVVSLSVDDTRKISSSLTAMINEKQKAVKEAQGGKKKKGKKTLVTGPRGGVDTTNYEHDEMNDFDDFM